MIRDPSDGSVKHPKVVQKAMDAAIEYGRWSLEELHRELGWPPLEKPSSANNWGLYSLDQPPRIPTPAPTVDQLREHYSKHNLRFQRKEQAE